MEIFYRLFIFARAKKHPPKKVVAERDFRNHPVIFSLTGK